MLARMDTALWLWILAGVLVLVGLAGTLLPVLPGIPLMLVGMLIAAWADEFTRIGWVTLTILTLLAAFSIVIEAAASAMGARRIGASRLAILGAALGALFGIFLGLVGLVLGPFIGALAGEFAARRDGHRAIDAGLGAWIGFVVGTVAKLAVAFTMLGVFLAAWIID
jgi:uncharacterized protein YqgC (DUF456 family)